jgi:hypothetical protein
MIQIGVYGVGSRSNARMNVSFLSLDIHLTPSLSSASGGEGDETASVKLSAPTYSAPFPFHLVERARVR